MADFVRGRPDGRFSSDTTAAIYLHRFVDGYIDNLPKVRACRTLFPKPLYRFSAIALDIFWDHALATHWSRYHSLPFQRFLVEAQQACELAATKEHYPLPENYLYLSKRMWDEGWLPSYEDINTLPFVLKRMASRSPRMAPLEHTADTLLRHKDTLLAGFPEIYDDVLNAAANFRLTQQMQKGPPK